MVCNNREWVAQEVLAPLLHYRGDGKLFSNISGCCQKLLSKWFAEVSNGVSFLR